MGETKIPTNLKDAAPPKIVQYIMLFLTSLKMYNSRSKNEWKMEVSGFYVLNLYVYMK